MDQERAATTIGIVVTGVAGQPVFSVAQLLADAALAGPCSVSTSGSPDARPGQGVEAHARIGSTDAPPGPRVMPGECHLVLGLEPLEAIRSATRYFTPGMKVISLTGPLPPTTVLHRGGTYPDLEQAAAILRNAGVQLTWLDGSEEESLSHLIHAGMEAVGDVRRPAHQLTHNPNM